MSIMSTNKQNDSVNIITKNVITIKEHNNTILLVNYLCSLSMMSNWPRVLFEIVSEYSRIINELFIFGGTTSDTTISTRWECVATCGRIVGDDNNNNNNNNNKFYDLPSMLTPRYRCASSHIGDSIYVTGGRDNDGVALSTIEQLHLPTLKWFIQSSLPTPFSEHGCVTVDNHLYCIGRNSLYRYRHEESKNGGVWAKLQSTKYARKLSSYISLNKRIYVFGGVELRKCEMFNVDTNRWTNIAAMTSKRFGACAVIVEGNILLLGGKIDQGSESTDTVVEYSVKSNSWRRMNWTLPHPASRFAAWYNSESKILYIALKHKMMESEWIDDVYMRRPLDTGEWMTVAKFPGTYDFGWTVITR